MQTRLINLLRRNRAIAWAALAALVLLQAGIAAHESQHALGDVAESCELCVQLDQPGAAATAVDAALSIPVARLTDSAVIDRVDSRRPDVELPVRAPPFI